MKPTIILHNQISLNGSITHFPINMELHYQLLEQYHADAHLIGSNTAKTGLTHFLDTIPAEQPADLKPPPINPHDSRPYWILIDSHAQLHNLLHIFRQYDYCKDVIVIITHNTPKTYQTYLKKRNYSTIQTGTQFIDLHQTFDILQKKYHINIIITDTGHTLNSILLQNQLINEISVIIAPELVGNTQLNIFKSLKKTSINPSLSLKKTTTYENHIHLQYTVSYPKEKEK